MKSRVLSVLLLLSFALLAPPTADAGCAPWCTPRCNISCKEIICYAVTGAITTDEFGTVLLSIERVLNDEGEEVDTPLIGQSVALSEASAEVYRGGDASVQITDVKSHFNDADGKPIDISRPDAPTPTSVTVHG
jgi:hypothetical protein